MMWRWFPIADDFVDFFSSRDTDSTLIQREIDSVNVWLNSNTLFHVMRDNPYHNTVILGGKNLRLVINIKSLVWLNQR